MAVTAKEHVGGLANWVRGLERFRPVEQTVKKHRNLGGDTKMKYRSNRWSPRSQQSMCKQRDLEEKLRTCELQLNLIAKRIGKGEADRKVLARQRAEGQNYISNHLAECIRQLEDSRLESSALKERREELLAEIKTLEHPTVAQRAHRARRQRAIAKAARERLRLDTRIEATVNGLGQLLELREALTCEMADAAKEIDLTIYPDGLDSSRFESLQAALPDELATESECWLAWFLGERRNTKSYTLEKAETFRETLADHGVHSEGDVVRVTTEQFAELSAEARPPKPADKSLIDVQTRGQIVAVVRTQGLNWEDARRKVTENIAGPVRGIAAASGAGSLQQFYERQKVSRAAAS